MESEEPPPKRLKTDDVECEESLQEVEGRRVGLPAKDERKVERGNDNLDTDGFLRECDVGITEYINNEGCGVFGILKQRYSDFIVHEISSTGQLVKLTSFDIPQDTTQETSEDLSTLVSSEELKNLQELSESKDKSKQVELKVSNCKESRTRVHQAIKLKFPILDSRTITGDKEDEKLIRVFLKGQSSRSNWPRNRGDYIKFVLYKENKDTMQAITTLSKMLRVKPSVFEYAGTKDKRAITTQHITVFRVTPQRLFTVNGANIGIKLGNFEYSTIPLKLGSNQGNHFNIVLRNVACKTENGDDEKGRLEIKGIENVVKQSIESLRDTGFVNYFGMQRFGTSVIPTHHVGRALLHSNWQQAIDLILQPRDGEPSDIHDIRQYYWETKDVSGTIKKIPLYRQSSVEMQLLKGLEKHGSKNLLAGLNFIPRGTRMMYVHGYQSYIWNRMASYRFREGGLKPILGDLVYKKELENESELGDQALADVEYINDSNIDLYSIYDIVLPLPGFTMKYPKNKVGDEYTKALAEDDLTSEKLLHRVKDFALPGGYRYLIVKPKDLKWDLLSYDDVTIPLTQSDLDIMAGTQPPNSIEGGSKMALNIVFTLPSSTYATMTLREILKCDTSSHYQSSLNQSDSLCNDEEEQ